MHCRPPCSTESDAAATKSDQEVLSRARDSQNRRAKGGLGWCASPKEAPLCGIHIIDWCRFRPIGKAENVQKLLLHASADVAGHIAHAASNGSRTPWAVIFPRNGARTIGVTLSGGQDSQILAQGAGVAAHAGNLRLSLSVSTADSTTRSTTCMCGLPR